MHHIMQIHTTYIIITTYILIMYAILSVCTYIATWLVYVILIKTLWVQKSEAKLEGPFHICLSCTCD